MNTGPGLSGALAVALFALRESVRRRVFIVVVGLTVAFLVLYGLGAKFAFDEVEDLSSFGTAAAALEEQTLTGSTVFGLAMFGTLFLGAVLAVFLTIGMVRGDAETGLLQPLVVRPVGRTSMLLARFAAAASASAVYVLAVYGVALLLTRSAGDWTPDHPLLPGIALAFAVAIVAAISVLASAFLSSTAQGITVFMVFGGGLVAGLLGQIGDALNSSRLERIAEVSSWALPFEAIYQHGLYLLTSESEGFTRVAVELGPFGGAQEYGGSLWLWGVVFTGGVLAAAAAAFKRRDL
ncbi:MAG TPA: ABC transporter permease subunit [Solirubrobacterales bacterium]|nr:ABC transporter permease subunit [Solirubrobacterales bacterium]